jgi:hypothetical protein
MTQGLEAIEADISTKSDGEYADGKKRGEAYAWLRSKADPRQRNRVRKGAVDIEYYFEHCTNPEND